MTSGMKYFMVLAEEQSISAAAKRLYITQQSLSEQMKRLEDSYGTTLFIRKPRFLLTPAGEALLLTLQKISVMEQSLSTQLNEIQEKKIGQLRVGIHVARARMFFPEVVGRFHKRYPNVTLSVFHDDTAGFEHMLQNGDLDLFLGVDTGSYPDFCYLPLADEPVYFVVAEQLLRNVLDLQRDSITIQEICKLDLIISPQNSNLRRRLDNIFSEASLVPKHVIAITDYELQLQLAAQNIGGCFCPLLFMGKFWEHNNMHPENPLRCFSVEGFHTYAALSLVYHKHAYHSEFLDYFIRIFGEELKNKMLSNEEMRVKQNEYI